MLVMENSKNSQKFEPDNYWLHTIRPSSQVPSGSGINFLLLVTIRFEFFEFLKPSLLQENMKSWSRFTWLEGNSLQSISPRTQRPMNVDNGVSGTDTEDIFKSFKIKLKNLHLNTWRYLRRRGWQGRCWWWSSCACCSAPPPARSCSRSPPPWRWWSRRWSWVPGPGGWRCTPGLCRNIHLNYK